MTATTTEFDLRPFTIELPGTPPIRGEVRTLAGAYSRSAIVVCHGFKGFRRWGFFPPLARALARRGHAVVTFDFSHNGVGADGRDFSALELFERNTHTRNVEEIGRVLDATVEGALTDEAPEAIGLFGHSRGGGEAVLAAAGDARVSALVTWAAIASVRRWTEEQVRTWEEGGTVVIPNARTGQDMPIGPAYWQDVVENERRLDILDAARRVHASWRIVHGTADESVPVTDARRLHEAAAGADLVEIPGAGHTFGAAHPFVEGHPDLREAVRRTAEWYDEHLGSGPGR